MNIQRSHAIEKAAHSAATPHSHSVEETSYEDESELHVAIRTNQAAHFTLLLANKPNLLVENADGQTALEFAEEYNHFYYVEKILHKIRSLDEAVPRERHMKLLGSFWFHENTEILKTASKFFAPQRSVIQYSYDGSATDRSTAHSYDLLPWIRDSGESADHIKISLKPEDLENALYHFLGKRAFLFLQEKPHLHDGNYVERIYTLMLGTWRTFYHSQPADPLYKEIDRAIADAIHPPANRLLARKIQKGISPVIIQTGWSGHSLTAVFAGDRLFICNRGRTYLDQRHALAVYRIDRNRVTPNLLRKFTSDGSFEDASTFLSETVLDELNARSDTFCVEVHKYCQPAELTKPICVAANLRLAINAILLSKSKKVNDRWDFMDAITKYKEYVILTRFVVLNRFLNGNWED